MQDTAFVCMGKGICIIPTEGKVLAPCDGVLTTLFPTGHACGITTLHGAEILIHIGSDTVNLPEGFFTKHKSQGDQILKGDLLISFDVEELKKLGYNTESAVIITNSKNYLDVIKVAEDEVDFEDEILVSIISEIHTKS